MKKTAIVLPIYNQEKYLSRVLDSLLNQTCGEWLAFCIDDGSTDATAGILSGYAAKDERFIIVTQENAGVATARNRGQEAALARDDIDTLMFVDPDDFLHPQCLEIVRGFSEVEPDAVIEWDVAHLTESEFLARNYDRAQLKPRVGMEAYSIWNKLYPIGVLSFIRSYPKARIAQDIAFVLELVHREKPRFIHIPVVLYYYETNPTSTVHRRLRPSDYECICLLLEYLVKIHEDDAAALKWLSREFLPGLMKRFWRDFRRVSPEDRQTCLRIFGRELSSLRSRGLLQPQRGSVKDLKYFVRFWLLAIRNRE